MEAISLLHVPGSRTLIEAGGMRALCDVMRRSAHDADMQVSHAGAEGGRESWAWGEAAS